MGRPRIGSELKKPSDYSYDYPGNREIAKNLTADDKLFIAFRAGTSIRYVRYWCQGKRRSNAIEEWAIRVMKLNQAKQKKLEAINN
ncbi:MAG: hypothetical protein WCL00_05515 [Bacteroidota bacterium]